MATLNSTTANKFSFFAKPISEISKHTNPSFSSLKNQRNPTKLRRNLVVYSVTEDKELAPADKVQIFPKGKRKPLMVNESDEVKEKGTEKSSGGDFGNDEIDRLTSRGINAAIVLGFGSLAVTKLLTIDHDYWHGWTLYEILRYAPEHNWVAYEEALKKNPVLAKMAISGVVYALGDWIAQCYEGKPLLEFDRTRMVRSGLVGFTLHGSLSHYYYQFCEALLPFKDWWVVPAKVAFDQTVWAALWNSIYYVVLGFLRLETPTNIFGELKATFWPMLTVRESLVSSVE